MTGDIFSLLADLAIVFHWPPSELWELPLDELKHWHQHVKARTGNL